jgi:hypothetical protein
MKYTVSFICFLLFSLVGMTQTPISLSALPSVTIHLKNNDGPLVLSSFRHFEVIDERADTSRIGIHTFNPTIGNSRNRQLIFPRPAAGEIAAWLNDHFTRPGAPYTALIVLRTLWLSDANYIREDKVKNPEILFDRTHIRLKVEIYAATDSFYVPILRYDTLQTYKRSNPYNNLATYYSLWDRDVSTMLSDMADSASSLALIRTDRGRQLHREDILQYNRSRFDPAITGSAALSPGVYASFEEFRSNTPSIQNFEIKLEKKNRLLYIKDAGGTSYYSHDAWGYCDGKSIYVMRDGVLYPAWKEGNAFYFFSLAYKENTANSYEQMIQPGNPSIVSPSGAVVPGTPGQTMWYPTTTTYKANLQRIYAIDMDSGKVY